MAGTPLDHHGSLTSEIYSPFTQKSCIHVSGQDQVVATPRRPPRPTRHSRVAALVWRALRRSPLRAAMRPLGSLRRIVPRASLAAMANALPPWLQATAPHAPVAMLLLWSGKPRAG